MALQALLTTVALLGHAALVVWLYNRLHTRAWPPRWIKFLERLLLAVGILLAAALVSTELIQLSTFLEILAPWPTEFTAPVRWFVAGYRPAMYLVALAVLPCWLIPKWRQRPAQALLSNDTSQIDVVKELGFVPARGRIRRWVCRLPGNQTFQVAVQHKNLEISRLPPEWDGLTIAHLSDLHLTGQTELPYYELLVERTLAFRPNLIVLTGDILEKEACLSWVEPIFGRLKAPLGCYFVLGNHELRLPDVQRLREALGAAGWTDLGGRSQFCQHLGRTLLMEGCEWPWHGVRPVWMKLGKQRGAGQVPSQPGQASKPALSILLTHTPDVWLDARQAGFDLVLAGHNHGGQICLPWIGPLIVPSRFGFRYAGGLYEQPPTLLHVSRGLGSTHSVRFRCPSELAILVLRAKTGQRSQPAQAADARYPEHGG